MRQFFTLATVIISSFLMLSFSQNKVAKPDFSYPENVTKQAIADIDKGIASHDGQLVIDALIRYSIAQQAIDPNRINQVTQRIDSVIAATTDVATRALLHMLQAREYLNAYNYDSWAYNERQLPLEPLPRDITEWSGDQFKMVINRELTEALKPIKALQDTPLNKYSKVIEADKLTLTYYPTLYDFVASQALEILMRNDGLIFRTNTRWLADRDKFITLDPSTLPGYMPQVIGIYQSLLKLHDTNTPAGAMVDCERLEYVKGHIDDTDENIAMVADAYAALARKLGDSEYAAFPLHGQLDLYAYGHSYGTTTDRMAALKQSEKYVQRHPDFFLTNEIHNMINQMRRKTVNISSPNVTTPGHPLPVKITATNTTHAELIIYQVNKPQYSSIRGGKKDKKTVIKRIDITLPDRPLEQVDTVVNVDLPGYGNYAITPMVDGEEDSYLSLVAVTDLLIGGINIPGTNASFVVNPVTGEPVEKVAVMEIENLSKDQRRQIGTTDALGLLYNSGKRDIGELYPKRGIDIYSPTTHNFYSEPDKEARLRATAYTALPIYHPGDSIDVAVIVASTDLRGSAPAPNKHITLQLFNPYYNAVTSVEVTTDSWGRAQAKLLAPVNGAQGSYHIQVQESGNNYATIIGSTSVMVSDYKMPQVKVTLNEPKMVAGKPVVISGKVTNYTDFPLADSKIQLSLSNTPSWRWWWSSASSGPFYTAQATTDADGNFTITVPAAALDNAPQPRGTFMAEVVATAPSGESQSGNVIFTCGKDYIITADIPDAINAPQPCNINAKIADAEGVAQIPLVLTLEKDGRQVARLPLKSDAALNLSDIPSGMYSYSLAPADRSISAQALTGTVVVYRLNDKTSPVDQLLWVPTSSAITADADGHAVMHVECSTDSTYALLTVASAERTLRCEWLTLHPGMNAIDLQLPAGVEMACASLIATRNLNTGTVSQMVRSVKASNKLQLHITSMRDKVTPGADEQITLTLTNADGSPAQGALIVDMWNKSLEVLAPLSMTPPSYHSSIYWRTSMASRSISADVMVQQSLLRTVELTPPHYNFYENLNGNNLILRSSPKMLEMAERSTAARGMNDMVKIRGIGKVEDAAEDAVEEVEMDEGVVQAPSANPYRDAATPLSFFRPMLTTDADGRVSLSYTVPNANALWGLNAIAYDKEMLSATAVAEIIASKPVMVQFNAPRFMRMGDVARLNATVMNATDRSQTIEIQAEFCDVSTGETINAEHTQRIVAANGSATATFTIKAPFGSSMVGYRILATAANYSDGERGAIPLLESVAPVIESDNFYMQPDQLTLTRELPPSSIDGTVTLQLCENPAWYVVAALPGLRADKVSTSSAAAAAIFSAATADGLLRTNPRIKSVIHRWVASDKSDSTLVSMLQRNDDLKIALLEATPWMVDASTDTERMGRLALLFDPKEVRSAIDKGIASLSKMQCNGGGWSWTPDYKIPSYWSTLNVLGQLGELKQLGFLPKDEALNSMIRNALTYLDRETAAQYRKYPKSDYMTYVVIRDYFADIPQSTAASRVTEATVQRIIAEWGEMSVTDKGVAAIILNNHGYNATARQVMRSIREYAEVNPDYGLWWPSLNSRYNGSYSKLASAAILLNAFNAVTPGSNDIDLLRQWIVVQKQTQNWHDAVVTTQLITSFLNSGTNWTVPPVGMSVEVNSQELTDRSPMAGTGEIRTNLTDMLAKTPGTLSITKPGSYPAWGAVIIRQRMELSAVKASPCEGLSIEKTLYKVAGNASGLALEPATNLAVGDKVRVDLLIKVDNDLDYVVLIDQRGACFEPVEQTPEPVYSQGLCFYRENRDATTNLYISHLPAGTYRLSYDLYVNSAGTYSGGVATIQSQYAPAITAHSAGEILTVN